MVKGLNTDDINWQGGVPTAMRFDDVYYSRENGLEETEHVFLCGIDAPSIWRNSPHFTIAETGFGTGLNFLATYKRWMESGAKGRLTFISCEAYPMSEHLLAKAHADFPALRSFSKQLRAAWPPPAAGFHPRYFEGGKIQLLLLFGDAAHSYSKLSASVDAWFLDGFSPAKNPAMWSDALFDQIARLSKPKARFATFTAAGFVKRALEQRGFDVRKTKGYGQKRARLVGTMNAAHRAAPATSWSEWTALPTVKTGHDAPVTILGAGVAGRALAGALTRRGVETALLSGDRPSASRVPAAVLAPGFQAGPQPTTDFVTAGFCHASWLPAFKDAWAPMRGVELYASTDADHKRYARILELLGWDKNWVHKTENGLMYPRSGSLDTHMALNALYRGPIEAATIERIEKTSAGWLLVGDGIQHETATLVIAAGAGAAHLLPGVEHLGLTARAGQIEMLEASSTTGATDTMPAMPAHSLAASGYITAATGGMQTLGSTFENYTGDALRDPAPSKAATSEILTKIKTEFFVPIKQDALGPAWAGIRAATTDYMPLIGPLPDWGAAASQYALLAKDRKITGLGPMTYQKGLYVFAGFGSKGFQQAPYAAEYLAAHLAGDALPMASNVAAYLHPSRAFIRRLIKSSKA